MRCVTYNIQYGIGLDGNYDLTRIADAVRGADVVALQEVTRNNPMNHGRDMVAEIRDLLPEYFSVYGPNFEVDMGSGLENGRAVDRHFQFGNMVLSKTPVLSSRNILLPRSRSIGKLNLQRGALEALIATEIGSIRFYSVHLDHRSPDERAAQFRFLMERVLAYPREGGALTGVEEMGFGEPPRPESFILMGDFNMLPGSAEYLGLTGQPDHEFGIALVADRPIDTALRATDEEPSRTWVDPKRPGDEGRWKRIDYCFASADLAARIKSSRVDAEATGSDHLPLWTELT